MKKYWKYLIAAAAIAVSAPTFTACSDNDEVDPYSINYVYMRQPNDTYANVEYKFNGDFLSGLEDPLALVPVRLTKPAPCDVTVEIAIDPTLVEEYNEANNGDYVFLTGAEVLTPKLTIKKGEYISEDGIVIGFTDHSGFFDQTKDLVLPVVVKAANGGVVLSKSSRIFLTFTSTYHANLISLTSDLSIFNDTDEEGWETANTNYTFENFLHAEWPVDDAVKVTLAIDNSLVATYNTENGTNYQTLPGTTLGATALEIPVGESGVDLSIKLGNYSGVANDIEYLVPVKINFVSGDGALLPEAFQVAYIEVTAVERVLSASTSRNENFTQFFGTNWSATEDGDDISYALTADDDYFSMTKGNQVVIDLGETVTVGEFCLTFYAWYYGLTNIDNVETSLDGNSWTSWGNVQLPDYAKTSYIAFSKPSKMRYIRYINGDYGYSDWYGSFLINITIWQK